MSLMGELDHAHWKDTGCTIGTLVIPSCLTCPLPVCKYDEAAPSATERSAIVRKLRSEDRTVHIFKRLDDGLTPRQIAAELGITRRSVFRLKTQYAHLKGSPAGD